MNNFFNRGIGFKRIIQKHMHTFTPIVILKNIFIQLTRQQRVNVLSFLLKICPYSLFFHVNI
eukprot:UN16037